MRIVLLLFLLVGFNAFSQQPDSVVSIAIDANDEEIYENSVCDKKAEYVGGEGELIKYLSRKINDQLIVGDEANKGKIYVRFVVTKTGEIDKIEFLRKADPVIENEVIRVLKSIPKWDPAKIDNKPVDSWYVLPINIHFQ